MSAYRDGERTIVLIPGRFSATEEKRWVDAMLARLEAGEQRRRPSDERLAQRASELSRRYLGARARPASIGWAANQRTRWGSCTPATGAIRISSRVQGMPGWVLDYVVLHELAHLLVAAHDDRFWALLAGYPRTERARGFLEGVSASTGIMMDDDKPESPPLEGQDDSNDPGRVRLERHGRRVELDLGPMSPRPGGARRARQRSAAAR